MGLICDSGLKVVFSADHASVNDKDNRELCHFTRKQGLYIAMVKLKNPAFNGKAAEPAAAGFQRPGR